MNPRVRKFLDTLDAASNGAASVVTDSHNLRLDMLALEAKLRAEKHGEQLLQLFTGGAFRLMDLQGLCKIINKGGKMYLEIPSWYKFTAYLYRGLAGPETFSEKRG